MTATTFSIDGFIFPQDFAKVTPEISRNLILEAKAVHTLFIAFSGVFLGMALMTVYVNLRSRTSLEESKQDLQSNPNNETLKRFVNQQESNHHISSILTNIAAACMLMIAGLFAYVGYTNWRDYHAVAFPELQRIANS